MAINPLLIPIVALSIPIVAIVMGGIRKIVQMVIQHRERMAMLALGMGPDVPEIEDAASPSAEAKPPPR